MPIYPICLTLALRSRIFALQPLGQRTFWILLNPFNVFNAVVRQERSVKTNWRSINLPCSAFDAIKMSRRVNSEGGVFRENSVTISGIWRLVIPPQEKVKENPQLS